MPTMDNAHALVIGIADYQRINKLPSTVTKDASDIHALLVDPTHCGYAKDNVELLLDDKATQAAIRDELGNLAERSDDRSTVFFYISSHGGLIESGPFAGEYLLPADTEYTSAESVARTAISGDEFTESLRAIHARRMVVVFDCCHSGGIGQPKDVAAPQIKALPESYYGRLEEGSGRVIFASSRDTEFSYIVPGDANSLFTKHMLAALRGGAPGEGGVVRVFDLFRYVQKRVTTDHAEQHPIFKCELEEDFPVALYLGGKAPAAAPAPTLADGYEQDVFISYSGKKPDRMWVRDSLLPRLEAAGIRATVDFRAPLGVPVITYIERAVQHSRYTLLVLSEAYEQSGYAEFEGLISQHLSVQEERRGRVLPIAIDESQPRLGLRYMPILRMSDEDEFDMNIDRLISQLRQPPEPLQSHS